MHVVDQLPLNGLVLDPENVEVVIEGGRGEVIEIRDDGRIEIVVARDDDQLGRLNAGVRAGAHHDPRDGGGDRAVRPADARTEAWVETRESDALPAAVDADA